MYAILEYKPSHRKQEVDFCQKGAPQCEPCNPCRHCDPNKIILPSDMVDDGITPGDMCDPCARWEHCSYCGDRFCRCDPIVEDGDGGIMHVSCAMKSTARRWTECTRELEGLRDQLSCSNAKIIELEELLEDTQGRLRRMIEDCSAEWEWGG